MPTLAETVTELDQRNAELVIEVVRARDAIMGLSNMFPTVAAGLAAVNDQDYFTVPGSGAYQRLFQRDGAQAPLIATYPSKEELQAFLDAVGPLQQYVTDHEAAADPHPQYLTQTELDTALANFNGATAEHTHPEYMLETDANDALNLKAEASHSHAEYALASALDGKASIGHGHAEYLPRTEADTALAGKAGVNHTHDTRYPQISAMNTAVNEVDVRGELASFVTGTGDVMTKTGGAIPSLAKYLEESGIGFTQGTVPDDYVSGPLYLIIDGVKSTSPFKTVDSYRPLAGDEVFAVKDIVVGVVAESQALMENFCKYYGFPISINALWDVELAAEFYSQYHGVVWGDGYGDPLHESHADTVAIAVRLKQMRPDIKIFGYVPIGLDPAWPDSNLPLADLYVRIDNWFDTGATHIFLDEYGYDYYVSRDRQNALVDYCHAKGMNVCANSWSADYCFSNQNIILDWINNFEGNPNLLPCKLTDQDYLQFENVLYKYHHEPGAGSTADPDQWVNDNQRIIDMYEYMYAPTTEYGGQSYYDVYGTRGYGLDAIISYDRKMFTEGYLVALALGMHAYAASVAFWGASTTTYHTYPIPELRASSRVALRPAQATTYSDTYVGRVTTQVGPEEIQITWVQQAAEMNFNEQSVNDQLTKQKHIFAVTIPPDTEIVADGFFTMTLGDPNDDALAMSTAISSADTQQGLLDKIANYSYSTAFTDIYSVRRESNAVVFESREPYTETNETFWVWHTPGALTNTIDSFTVLQVGSNGLSKDYREVMLNGETVDFGFGPFWRRPRNVEPGYIYYDTSNKRNIIFRDRTWYDLQGNVAEEFVNYPTQADNDARYYTQAQVDAMVSEATPLGSIVLKADSAPAMGAGWVLCDGANGSPDLRAEAHTGTQFYMKV